MREFICACGKTVLEKAWEQVEGSVYEVECACERRYEGDPWCEEDIELKQEVNNGIQ